MKLTTKNILEVPAKSVRLFTYIVNEDKTTGANNFKHQR